MLGFDRQKAKQASHTKRDGFPWVLQRKTWAHMESKTGTLQA